MSLTFASSPASTLGLEWELALVDPDTGALRPVAEQVIAELNSTPEADRIVVGHVTGEYLMNTVELVTGVCSTVSEGLDQLASTAQRVISVAQRHGAHLYSQGSHPFAEALHEPVSPADRYGKMLDRTQWWGRQMVIYGVHVHVGVAQRDRAMAAVNQLVNYSPHLLALSASSPFWEGVDTGYQSQRTLMFQQLPTSGLPFQFEQWSGFEQCVADLTQTGVIDDVSECRWDLRAVPRLGTVEMRVCDGMSTLEEIGAVAALTQCLVHDATENGAPVEIMAPWYVQENKWRAARYGLDAIIIVNGDGDELLVTEHLDAEIERLTPVAEQLGCVEELGWVRRIIEQGGTAAHQRQVAARAGSVPVSGGQVAADPALVEVVRDASRRTHTSVLEWNN
ncbi:glutamate--cysteine ligase [Citricoccus sp. NR2]|uniref:glutamate--cysteine ligase n=1 Tax=Citricoccus sp. NR2 TaxID=3004095 RepID=UPI0022DE8367|nr:glutamate--cysteine ligase [Citricoccus sp. NR2]WBL17786.1 glutamate--cysteine ligase [Citricoccus sp. NR2]